MKIISYILVIGLGVLCVYEFISLVRTISTKVKNKKAQKHKDEATKQ